jgi:gliding motility-associated-like protein
MSKMLKMSKFGFLLILIIGIFGVSIAQHEHRNWYFGSQAGLRFSDTGVVVLLDGVMDAIEGCSVISDSSGDLLFYTNGSMIWNRQHQRMPNGFGLFGDRSTTQSSLIVQQPGSSSLYYVFTLDEQGKRDGFRFSVVDMTLEGGFGDIVVHSKNTLLSTPVTEKISATYHGNGRDIWILVHSWGNNDFLAYLLTDSGLVKSPVVSSVGLDHTGVSGNTIGQMKISEDGKKVISAVWFDGLVQLFDFDFFTGEVRNPITIPSIFRAYGCEFSLDCSKLYIGTWVSVIGSSIYQFDIQSSDSSTIVNSRKLISPFNSYQFGSLQVGMDGRIYVAVNQGDYLSCILDPTLMAPMCDFRMDFIDLQGRKSGGGLPNILQRKVEVIPDFEVQGHCMSSPVCFLVPTMLVYDSIVWYFGGDKGVVMTSGLTQCHTFNDTGLTTVKMKCWYGGSFTQVEKEIRIHSIPVHAIYYTICEGEDFFHQGVRVSVPAVLYDTFYNGSDYGCDSIVETHVSVHVPIREEQYFEGCEGFEVAVGSHQYNKTGVYYDHLGDCDTLVTYVNIYSIPTFRFLSVNDTCGRKVGKVKVSHLDGVEPFQYHWNTGSFQSTLEDVGIGRYILEVTDQNGCVYSDSIDLHNIDIRCFDAFIPQAFSPNGDGNNDVFEMVSTLIDWVDVRIYNRWGALVYHSNELGFGWDGYYMGMECPIGIYSVVISYANYRISGDTFTYRGTLHLMR